MYVKRGFGTMSWLERTGGKLAWWDRLNYVCQGIRLSLASRRRAGIWLPMRDLHEIIPPDTPVTREAFALCEDISPPFLLNHCLRAYFWARLLDDDTRPFDDEALFAACLLHDFGLCEHHRGSMEVGRCFTAEGAKEAAALALRHGWPDQRAAIVADAIALHLNILVGEQHGKEAQMLRTGSGADTAGLRLQSLSQEHIDHIVERYPRLDLKKQLSTLLEKNAQAHPCSRIGLMMRKFHFGGLIRNNPYFQE